MRWETVLLRDLQIALAKDEESIYNRDLLKG